MPVERPKEQPAFESFSVPEGVHEHNHLETFIKSSQCRALLHIHNLRQKQKKYTSKRTWGTTEVSLKRDRYVNGWCATGDIFDHCGLMWGLLAKLYELTTLNMNTRTTDKQMRNDESDYSWMDCGGLFYKYWKPWMTESPNKGDKCICWCMTAWQYMHGQSRLKEGCDIDREVEALGQWR